MSISISVLIVFINVHIQPLYSICFFLWMDKCWQLLDGCISLRWWNVGGFSPGSSSPQSQHPAPEAKPSRIQGSTGRELLPKERWHIMVPRSILSSETHHNSLLEIVPFGTGMGWDTCIKVYENDCQLCERKVLGYQSHKDSFNRYAFELS